MNWNLFDELCRCIRKFKVLALCSGYFIVPVLADADTATLQNGVANEFSGGVGYEGTSDTYVWQGYPYMNFGATQGIIVGNSGVNSAVAALLRFDLSSFVGKKVTGPATLRLVQVNPSGGTGESTFAFNIYEVSEKDANWVAGGKDRQDAEDGESTWNAKMSPSTPWSDEVEANNPGISYKPTPLVKMDFEESKGAGNIVEISLPAALIQRWIDHPESNGGLLMVWQSGDTYVGEFRSSEFGEIAARPELKFDYK